MNTAVLDAATRRSDLRTIALIGLAHGSSHFHHLLLPPLFPVFIREFGLSWSELGLLVTVFFVISGIGQALSGFLVDRVGARPVLMAAVACFVLASLAAGTATGYGGLLLAASLAGIGNCPFHPADFTVLNQRVSPKRLPHAFSVHGVSGSLGWAATPVLLIGVEQASGNWRLAYAATALLALAVLAALWWGREAIGEDGAARRSAAAAARAAPAEHPLAFLRLPSVWLCFSFFFWSTAALSAIQSFASPALAQAYGLAPAVAALVVTGYLLCGAAGIIVGGFVAGGGEKLERNIAACLALAAALLLLVASGGVPPLAAAVLTAAAGFGTGLAGPSRDMLIRRASPPGATGRVYGTVYSGLDVGFALAAPVFGALMDRGLPRGVFLGAALTLAMGIASAALVAAATRRRTTVAA